MTFGVHGMMTKTRLCLGDGMEISKQFYEDDDMSVGFVLINNTKREQVAFSHIPVSTNCELAGNSVSAAITTWYLLENSGDEIAFVSDTLGEWPFANGSRANVSSFPDVTDRVVEQLIDADIIRDDGIAWADEDEPETIYMRALTNVWIDS